MSRRTGRRTEHTNHRPASEAGQIHYPTVDRGQTDQDGEGVRIRVARQQGCQPGGRHHGKGLRRKMPRRRWRDAAGACAHREDSAIFRTEDDRGAAATHAAGQFSTEAQAKARCPGDTVVWVNLDSKIYHYSAYRDYGHTKDGAYMCERDTAAAGFRAAKNEKHPCAESRDLVIVTTRR